MKKLKLNFLIALFSGLIVLVSCNKDDDSEAEKNFYVSGIEYNTSGNAVAKYWKEDGTETVLSDGQEDVYVSSYFLNGNDVHTVGYNDDLNKGVYYKNGQEVILGEGEWFSDVFVSGNDVYISGNDNNVPKVWKNGVSIPLNNNTTSGDVRSVFVNGNDVYVVGETYNSIETAKYWKNGNLETTIPYFVANKVFVDGNDVYITGMNASESYRAAYWKNGTIVTLENTLDSRAYDIKVKDGDVYAAGFVENKAVYWKNGVRTELSNGGQDRASKMEFIGNDLYISGCVAPQVGGRYRVVYWKNGQQIDVTDGTHDAYDANIDN